MVYDENAGNMYKTLAVNCSPSAHVGEHCVYSVIVPH